MFSEQLAKGSGLPIVFLHGFLGCSKDWQSVVSHIKNRTCIAYDLPGHGNTPWTDIEIEDLLFNALPYKSIDLVGYSMGGRIAMRFALKYPSQIHSLTLISSHFGLATNEERQMRLQDDQLWAQKILSMPMNDFLFAWYSQPIFASLRDRDKMINIRQNQNSKGLATAMLSYSLGRQDCLKERLQKFSRPFRILYGEKDLKFAKLFASMANVHCILDAGHALHLEAPQEVARFL